MNKPIDIKIIQKQALKDQIRASLMVIFDVSHSKMNEKCFASPNEIVDWVFNCIALPIIDTKDLEKK